MTLGKAIEPKLIFEIRVAPPLRTNPTNRDKKYPPKKVCPKNGSCCFFQCLRMNAKEKKALSNEDFVEGLPAIAARQLAGSGFSAKAVC